MLQAIRERTGKWILVVIVGAIAVSMLGWGLGRYMNPGNQANTVARVNGHNITQREFQMSFQQLKADMKAQLGGQLPKGQRFHKYFQQRALQQLIRQVVLEKAAKDYGFTVNQDQLVHTVRDLPYFQVNGKFSAEKFDNFIKKSRLNRQRLFTQLHQRILISQPLEGLRMSAFVLPDEMTQWAANYFETRDFDYLTVNSENLKSQIKLSDKQLKNYYQQHQKQFQKPEQVKINYIKLSFSDLKKQIDGTNQQIRDFYQQHRSMFAKPKQWQLTLVVDPKTQNQANSELIDKLKTQAKHQAIDQLIQQSDRFNHLKTHTINLTERSTKHKWLLPVVKQMRQGQWSKQVKTPDGHAAIVKLKQYHKQLTPKFEDIKSQVRQALIEQKAKKQYREAFEKLSDLAYRHPTELKPLAKQFTLTVHTSRYFGRNEKPESGIAQAESIRKTAFKHDVLVEGNNSAPVKLDASHIVVLRVKDHVKQQTKSFSQVKNKVRQKLIQKQSIKKAGELAKRIKKRIANDKSSEDLLKRYGWKWHTATDINARDEDLPPKLLRQVFAMNLSNSKSSVAMIRRNDHYTVIKLKQIKPGNISAFPKKDQKQYQQQLRHTLASSVVQHYVKHQMHLSDIRVFSKQLKQ